MQSTICILLIAIAASKCRAKVRIIQGNDISIEFDKPLEITFTNDKTSDVVFRHEQLVVAYCHRAHGCNIDDGRFHITQNTSAGRNEYILTSNAAIQTALCGVYECKDLLSSEKNSAKVSIIGFDNETYNATEEKDTIYLTTECIFHVSLSDMGIYWYTYDNTTLRLLDENEMEASMTLFNSASVCSDECGTISAYKFTFGLNITDEEQGSVDVFIETKIFHPDYINKPLTWRSSNTFRVKESSPKTPTSGVLMAVIVLVSVCVTVSIGFLIYALIRFRRKRSTNTKTHGNTARMIRRCIRRLLSRWGKAAKPRHTETQPVGESDRDLHSQSDEDIHLCVKVLRDDAEIESDRVLQCNLWANTHHLRYLLVHDQSDEDIPICVEVLRDDTEIESDSDLQCIVGKNTPFPLLDSCIHSQSDKDMPLGVEVLGYDTEIESDVDLRYNSEKSISLCFENVLGDDTKTESDGDLHFILGENTHHLQDSCIHSQSDEDISLYEGEMVSIHDTEIESDTDLQCIVGENTQFPLLDSCIHSQSGEDLFLSLFEKEKLF